MKGIQMSYRVLESLHHADPSASPTVAPAAPSVAPAAPPTAQPQPSASVSQSTSPTEQLPVTGVDGTAFAIGAVLVLIGIVIVAMIGRHMRRARRANV